MTDHLYERLEELTDPEWLFFRCGPVLLHWVVDEWDVSLDPELDPAVASDLLELTALRDLVEHAHFPDLVEALEWVTQALSPLLNCPAASDSAEA